MLDSGESQKEAHGKQEGVAYNGHFAKNCFHPLFCFTSEGDCLRAKLRPGNVHSADGTLEGARVSYHARRWYVHVASAFPLAHHYRAVLAWGP